MISLFHFVSIFASLGVLALAFVIIQQMIGTYQDRILDALSGGKRTSAIARPVKLMQRQADAARARLTLA